jgi:two-component system alkaline phosphatase synthesis response regulator PhoP
VSGRILVVDDEPSIAALVEYHLRLAGYDVRCVADGESVFDALGTFRPDLIVLDRMLPRMDGLEVCRRLRRERHDVPVIMLTALNDVADRIAGLAGGADDYMAKPFSPQELIARIGAIFRRTGRPARPEESGVYRIGRLTVRADAREVELDGRPVELTPKEFDLLLFLCRRRGKVLSRRQILHGVWDCPIVGDTRIVDVHISHLRDKIEKNARSPEYIITVRSVGYKLTGPPEEPTTA